MHTLMGILLIILIAMSLGVFFHALFMAIIDPKIRQSMINDSISIPNPCGRRISRFLIAIGYPMHLIGILIRTIFFKICPNDK